MSKFSENIKELRKEKNLTQAEFAKKLNVLPRVVSFWESGSRECNFDMLIKIADTFSVSTDYLLGRKDFF